MKGKLGFTGELGIKVIRARPTWRTRIADFVSKLLGRYRI
jgi:hypothetical protein